MSQILKDTAQGWLKVAIKEIRARLQKLRIGQSGELLQSISGQVKTLEAGVRYEAEIHYNYYGIFPDMGVGKGVSSGDVKLERQLGGGRRRKPWTRAVAAQSHRFGETMHNTFAAHYQKELTKDIPGKITMRF